MTVLHTGCFWFPIRGRRWKVSPPSYGGADGGGPAVPPRGAGPRSGPVGVLAALAGEHERELGGEHRADELGRGDAAHAAGVAVDLEREPFGDRGEADRGAPRVEGGVDLDAYVRDRMTATGVPGLARARPLHPAAPGVDLDAGRVPRAVRRGGRRGRARRAPDRPRRAPAQGPRS